MSTTRREFLVTGATLAAAAAGSRVGWAQAAASQPALSDIPELKTPESKREGDMLYRTLAKTGEKVSILGLGGYHFANFQNAADSTKLLRRAVDAGVTFMDNCWDYHNGESERRMGDALNDGYRKKVFLMTKIDGQTQPSAEKQINESLTRLRTDVIDLLQIHENIRMGDAGRVFGSGGSMEAIRAAKKAGKIRYIGFTGHKDPSIHLHMLDVAKKNDFHFDSAQMPLNLMDAHFRSFAREVVPRLVREGTGVLGMKPMASGSILSLGTVTGTQCLHYAMNLPTSVVITGMDSDELLDQALAAVKSFKPFTATELAALLAKTREAALRGTYEAFKTTQQFDGTTSTPAWLG